MHYRESVFERQIQKLCHSINGTSFIEHQIAESVSKLFSYEIMRSLDQESENHIIGKDKNFDNRLSQSMRERERVR